MPRQLDLASPIVTKDGLATAYFEDLIFLLYQATNPTGVDVDIVSGIATVDLSKGSQFNITATSNFVIDVIGTETRADNDNVIDIVNPGGAYNLTNITADAGVTVQKAAGSSIAILGSTQFSFEMRVPTNTKIQVIPQEMEPL
jgi:hypothetical protein